MRRRSQIPAISATRISVLLALSVALLAACGQQPRASVASTETPVVGWKPISPPWSGKVGVDAVSRYIISRDVAGLIVACYGQSISTDPSSQGLTGTAHLWRTRDGGAHWQALAATISLGECGEMRMIVGGDGLLVTGVTTNSPNNGDGIIQVSADAGDTWKTVSIYLPDEIAANRLIAMQQAVYRDGRLYTSLIFNGPIIRLFSVSDDDGLTWTTLDQVPKPAPGEMALETVQFAPDYSAPQAWFRYTDHGPLNASLPHYTTLDRSTDDGRTWKAISTLNANGALLEEYYGHPLVTSPAHPLRLCVGLELPEPNSLTVGYGDDLVLGVSDDGGATWHYAPISHHSQDGRTSDPEPIMDANGNCYVSVAPFYKPSSPVASPSTDSTILRLAPGSGAQPGEVATFTQQVAGLLSVWPSSQPNEFTLCVLSSPISAENGTIDYDAMSLLVRSVTG